MKVKEQILQEVNYALSPDEPVGFLAIVLSKSKPLGRVVPTIIELNTPPYVDSLQQRKISEKLRELSALIGDAYAGESQE